jgi:hypothetical protein
MHILEIHILEGQSQEIMKYFLTELLFKSVLFSFPFAVLYLDFVYFACKIFTLPLALL